MKNIHSLCIFLLLITIIQSEPLQNKNAFQEIPTLKNGRQERKTPEVNLVLQKLLKVPASCDDSCSKLFRPVCGTDGVTYLNPCHLQCAKKLNPKLRLAHDGPCTS